jgi:hypothetical protein
MSLSDYDIVGSFNAQRYPSIDAERIVNCFEYIDQRDKKQKTLIQTSGLINTQINFPSITDGAFRAQFVFKENMYAVIGNGIYLINSSLVATRLQTINTISGYLGIDANTFQVIFVDGVDGWIYDTDTNTMEQITDISFPASPIDVTYLDGFFVVANGGTNTFQLSSFNQGLIWGASNTQFTVVGPPTFNLTLTTAGFYQNYQIGTPVQLSNSGGALPAPLTTLTTYYVVSVNIGADTIQLSLTKGGSPISLTTTGTGTQSITNFGQLQQGSLTSHPGTIQACRTLHRRLFLFAENFTEVWENAGIGTNLPFRRNNSLLMEYGTISIASVKASFDMMCFLSKDKDGQGAVMAVFGAQSVPISNRALDFNLARYAALNQIKDADGILIKENGIIFYRLNFTGADHTYVYNVTMSDSSTEEGKRWHEEQILNGSRHLAKTHAFFNGKNYYGNYLTHIMYSVDPNETRNAGEIIPRIIIGRPYCPPDYRRLRIDRFQLDLLQGQDTSEQFFSDFTADSTTDLITVNISSSIPGIYTGYPVTVSTSGGVLPQPLASFTTYYAIIVSNNTIRLATTRSNAISNNYINLTTNGTPINLINIIVNRDITPVVYLSYSKDGGQSYGNRLTGTMGQSGQRSARTVWRKLGTVPRGQGFVPKIEFFNQVPFVVLGAAWSFEVMPE